MSLLLLASSKKRSLLQHIVCTGEEILEWGTPGAMEEVNRGRKECRSLARRKSESLRSLHNILKDLSRQGVAVVPSFAPGGPGGCSWLHSVWPQRAYPILLRMVSLILASFQTSLSWVLNRVIQLGLLKWVTDQDSRPGSSGPIVTSECGFFCSS